MRTVALLNVVQWNHIHCSMLLCLDYAANYNEKVRLPPPITAYILLYISVYMAVFCIYWGWSAESGLSCGQVYTNDLVKEYGDRYRSAMKKLARVPEEFFGKLDLNNQIRGLLRLIPLKKFHICTIKINRSTQPDFRLCTPVFCCSDWRSQKISKSYAPKYLDGKRIQTVDTYYSAVGILDELTPEEMEEVFQKSLAERKKTETA